MRKLFVLLIPSIFLVVLIFLTSCQKELSNSKKKENNVSEKVNTWLNNQKSLGQPNKAVNIELLKSSLDFSRLKYEQFSMGDQLIIIPIKENFKTKKNGDKNSLLNLVLIDDKSGVIKSGRIALYTPEADNILNKIPDNTFNKVLNTEPIESNGMFRFLSVTGQWLHQFEYKNGRIHSFGEVKQKTTSNAETSTTSRQNATCIDWYLVTTWYVNGVPVHQDSQYIGTTCGGGACDDPNFQSLCPDDNGGSGGNGGGINDIVTTSDMSSTVEVNDDTDGAAPKIRFQYNSNIIRTNGLVTSVVVYPTTIANPFEVYIDTYGRNTTRTLTVFGNYQTGTPLGFTALCFWSCFVYGRWVYTDGSPEHPRTWPNTHSSIR